MNEIFIENFHPTVSVFMMAYNHEKYIAEAIEGVLMQRTNFDFDIVIGEDCSTDNTRQIIIYYQQKHPGKFKLLLHERSIGAMSNQIAVLKACQGKYIALCEGDDYWTDPYKLQKQVDFLEANEGYSMCGHRFQYFYQETGEFKMDYFEKMFSNNQKQTTLTLENFYCGLIPQILTLMIRRDALDINHILKFKNAIDVVLYYCLFKNGNAGILDFVGGVYRKHDNGVYSRLNSYGELKRDTHIFQDLYKVENTIELQAIYLNKLKAFLYQYFKYEKKLNICLLNELIKDFHKIEKSNKTKLYIHIRLIKALTIRFLKKKIKYHE